jgi:hypothetical protein
VHDHDPFDPSGPLGVGRFRERLAAEGDYLLFSERAVAMGWRSNRRQVGVMPRTTAPNAMAAIAAATNKSTLGSIAPRLAKPLHFEPDRPVSVIA